jgi:hypothetical protein
VPSLSTIARQEYYAELGNSLPPPVLDKPEYRERRMKAAVETFEALHPGDAYEARLAVQIVLSAAHAAEALREAGVFRDDFAKRTKCRAQAASMMREESSAKRTLEREQKVRLTTEAVADTPKAQPPVESAPRQPAGAQAAATARQSAPELPAVASPRPAATQAPPPPSPEAIAKAETFADEHIEAAAQIRRDRGVTPQNKARFRHLALPTDPAVIDALVRGTSDILTLLDEVGSEKLDVAA